MTRVTLTEAGFSYESRPGWSPLRWTGAEVVAVDGAADTITLSFRRDPAGRPHALPFIGTRLDLVEMGRSPYWSLVDDT